MASPTVLSIGGVSITANGGSTGDALYAIEQLFKSGAVESVPAVSPETTIPLPPADGKVHGLVIEASYTGALSIPAGYKYVIYGGTGTLIDNHASGAAIVGNAVNFSGSAASVISAGGTGHITDNQANALIDVAAGHYTINLAGNGDTVHVDSGSSFVSVKGSNEHIYVGTVPGTGGQASGATGTSSNISVLRGINDVAVVLSGDNTIGALGANSNVDVGGGSNYIFALASAVINQTAGDSTIQLAPGGVVTVNATGGSQIIYDYNGGNLIHAGPSTEFVSDPTASSASTLISSGGADTIFATSAVSYDGTAATGTTASLFVDVAKTGAATVVAAKNQIVFAGQAGGNYTVGSGSFFLFGGGGVDNIYGAAGSAPVTVWGNTNERVVMSDSLGGTGDIFYAFGNNDTINATNTPGKSEFLVVNQTLPSGLGGTFAGNTTLIGSSAGNDVFNIFTDSSNPAPHTIDIQNWQASDSMFVGNLSGGAGEVLSSTDATAIANFLSGGGTSFTLQDGTTVEFTNTNQTKFTIGHG
jgi:hypothetical protein